MSRHHMLPPMIYTPALRKPKETRRRRSVGYVKGKDATDEAEEIAETGEVRTAASAHGAAAPPSRSIPDDAAERRPHPTPYHISENTLTALLALQEQKGPQGTDGTTDSENAAGVAYDAELEK